MTTDPTALLPRARKDRAADGKALRERMPLGKHADFIIDKDRDPMPILRVTDPQRVPSLVPERYRRMSDSPFAFYRGGAALMAHDLTLTPRIGLPVQACGDCHLLNFGVFSSPEGNILFDINDFDETYPGVDFIVDLKRLATSVAVAAQDAHLSDKAAQGFARATVTAYREFMAGLAARSPLDIWQTRMELKDQLKAIGNADLETDILKSLLKAEKKEKTSDEAPGVDLKTMTFEEKRAKKDETLSVFHKMPDGTPVHRVLDDAARNAYEASLPPERAALLRRYAMRDVAFKVVGVGSVGTYCAIGLWATADGDTMILQVKQAWQSAVAGLAPGTLIDAHQGQRVVDGQRAMQAASDPFLGWTQDDTGRQFYLRRLKNRRLGKIGEEMEGKALGGYAALCGRTLARAHAHTGDAAMISGYLGDTGEIDEALATFAMAYASQTVLDWEKLKGSMAPKR